MGDITAILRNVSGLQNVDQETCAETIRGMEIIGNSADVKYWAEECIELNPPFEVKSGAAFLADFKPYGKESYYWTVKDHLSAVRVILDDDGDVVHSQDYYAFGLRCDYNDSPAYDKNRVGVIEQTGVAQSLDLMDYRLFDRTTGRFLSVDPLADQFPGWSPYNYTMNNPINMIDPTGMAPETIYEDASTGEQVEVNDGVDKTIVVNSTDFEAAQIYASILNPYVEQGELAPAEVVDSYSGFYESVNSYDGFSLANAYDYMYGGPNITSDRPLAGSPGDIIGGKKSAAKVVSRAKSTLWTATKSKSAVQNALAHWKKHAKEFPGLQNAKQYVEQTKSFLNNSPAGTLTKTRANGDVLKYNQKTNTFGVMNKNGVPRTMFKPSDGIKYWNKQ